MKCIYYTKETTNMGVTHIFISQCQTYHIRYINCKKIDNWIVFRQCLYLSVNKDHRMLKRTIIQCSLNNTCIHFI